MAITKIQSESLNLADTYDFTGTVTGAGGTNTPAFFARANATQTGVTDATWTKATLGAEDYDTASAFASDKFTVPSGQGGKYNFSFGINIAGNSDYMKQGMVHLYKNGSALDNSYRVEISQKSGVFNMNNFTVNGNRHIDLSAGDYIELYGRGDVNSGNLNFYNAFLCGHKIIE
jgi:hypothetical protein